MTFWQYFWLLAWAFLFVAWLMLLFSVFADLFGTCQPCRVSFLFRSLSRSLSLM